MPTQYSRSGRLPAGAEWSGKDPGAASGERLGEQLVRQRTTLGLSQKEAARQLGVDPGTLARWERDEREPTGKLAALAERLLAAGPPAAARTA